MKRLQNIVCLCWKRSQVLGTIPVWYLLKAYATCRNPFEQYFLIYTVSISVPWVFYLWTRNLNHIYIFLLFDKQSNFPGSKFCLWYIKNPGAADYNFCIQLADGGASCLGYCFLIPYCTLFSYCMSYQNLFKWIECPSH